MQYSKFHDKQLSRLGFGTMRLPLKEENSDAKEKYELLTERGIPVWVMEPVRGGRLANLNDVDEVRLKRRRPEESIASWGFRFLQNLPNVAVVLSGMSNIEQMQDNVKTFSEGNPLSEDEVKLLLDIAEGMKNSIPCTACRYCCDGCPQELDIPSLLAAYNEVRFIKGEMPIGMQGSFNLCDVRDLAAGCIAAVDNKK